MTSAQLIDALRRAGLRMTPQRAAICEFLAGTRSHPTASQIHRRLRARYPSLSLTTVYSTLDTLARLGAINELGQVGDDAVHYDADTTPHVNLACLRCQRIVDIESRQAARVHKEVSAASGFALLGARVVYYGLCPSCRTSNPE